MQFCEVPWRPWSILGENNTLVINRRQRDVKLTERLKPTEVGAILDNWPKRLHESIFAMCCAFPDCTNCECLQHRQRYCYFDCAGALGRPRITPGMFAPGGSVSLSR